VGGQDIIVNCIVALLDFIKYVTPAKPMHQPLRNITQREDHGSKVEVYTWRSCPCIRAKELLRSKGVELNTALMGTRPHDHKCKEWATPVLSDFYQRSTYLWLRISGRTGKLDQLLLCCSTAPSVGNAAVKTSAHRRLFYPNAAHRQLGEAFQRFTPDFIERRCVIAGT